ncbi:hypothetical protein LIER_05443 [Lithospermum erythrorhizon]|uniref:Uncharacterized protein n=1 Tax=Lithospermum erythrorhizon TaxID=34254 RepID=A0AAV3P1T7_LITER
MENYRSMSVTEGKMQIDNSAYGANQAPKNMNELRSYSTSYVTTGQANANIDQKEVKIKKFKSKSASSAASMGWSFNDPELQRKKRVVSYKVYSVEGKMKGSLRKSFRWIKDTCGWF